ncbi:MAG: hypothetical protein R3C11_16370 [Planctomycetaceae bacterium]
MKQRRKRQNLLPSGALDDDEAHEVDAAVDVDENPSWKHPRKNPISLSTVSMRKRA